MTTEHLLRQFQFDQMTLDRLLADVSQADSLRVVQPADKSINWLLGHIVSARAKLLGILGMELPWKEEIMGIYGGPDAPPFAASSAKPLSDLRALLNESLRTLDETLRKNEAMLEQPCDGLPHVSSGGTIADRVGAFACHEAYHVGQIGLMRRLMGKPGLF